MDSTFLGILAGVALEVRKAQPQGTISLCRLSERNMELVQNLGLHRLMEVSADEEGVAKCSEQLKENDSVGEKMILEAHENLIEADEENAEKFQDVVSFLKKQIDQS